MIGFDELFRRADAVPSPVPVVAAGAADATVLEALAQARDRGWIAPIAVGPARETRELAASHGIDLHGFEVVDGDPADLAPTAVSHVLERRDSLLMKGRIATPDLMRAVLDHDRGLRTGRAIAQVVLMEITRDSRCFLLADTGVMIRPSLAQKVDLVGHLSEVAHALGTDRPRIAAMAASEKPTPAMPETIEAAELERMSRDGEIAGCVVQGPLSFDLAYAADAAGKKGLMGEVVGHADAMVFPDLSSANLTVKAIMYTAACRFGGVLRGTSHPVVFMSRSDSTATRLCSLALAVALRRPPE